MSRSASGTAEQAQEPILRVRGLKVYFPIITGGLIRTTVPLKAVDEVSFDLYPGETLGVVGESGCGKSTLGRGILQLLEPTGGSVVWLGNHIEGLPAAEMKSYRKEMQIIFQDPFGSLNPRMTAGQTIEEGLRTLGIRGHAERKRRVNQLLEMVGMSSSGADRYPHEFSGGQRQRIGIARALSVEPSLIVCDEPVSALDVSIQAQIINLLKELQNQLGLSYLFISHDLNVVGYISDTVAVMYLGHIMEYAPAEALYDNPLHPYTRALLSSIPTPEPDDRSERQTLSGDVPSPFNPPPGCKFQGRCPIVEDRCRKDEISFYEAGENHVARCWKVVE